MSCGYLIFCFRICRRISFSSFFFFNDTATTEIYTLSLHDALPICFDQISASGLAGGLPTLIVLRSRGGQTDRKSTRLNSSHTVISYAVFCLKKKKNNIDQTRNCATHPTANSALSQLYVATRRPFIS